MNPHAGRVIFGEYTVDLGTGELLKSGALVPIQGKSFQVLAALIARPGQLVSREDLRSALWPADVAVEFDDNLNTAVNRLRRVLDDSAEHPRFIETLPGRGYRLLAPVETVDPPSSHATRGRLWRRIPAA